MKRSAGLVRAAMRLVSRLEVLVGCLLMAMIFALMLLQVMQRYLPGGAGVWVGELARFGLVWLTFAIAGFLVGKDEHVTIAVADTFVKGRLHRYLMVFVNIVIAAVAVLFVRDSWALVSSATGQGTPAMGIPLTAVYIIPLLGFALSALHALSRAAYHAFVPDAEQPAGSGPPVTEDGAPA